MGHTSSKRKRMNLLPSRHPHNRRSTEYQANGGTRRRDKSTRIDKDPRPRARETPLAWGGPPHAPRPAGGRQHPPLPSSHREHDRPRRLMPPPTAATPPPRPAPAPR